MRPLNLGETLDASIKIVRSRWSVLATVMIVVALPIQLIDMLIIQSTTDVYQVGSSFATDTASTKTTYSHEGAYVAGQVVIQLLSVLGYLLGTLACYRAIADAYLGRQTTAEESLRFAWSRFGAALWLTILLVAGLIAAFLALVLPGIWLGVAWSVAIPVLLVEGTGGVAALKRSFELVQGRWWATFGRLAVAYILVMVITTVATLVLLVPATQAIDDTSFAALLLEHVANFLVSLVTTPFLAAVTTLVYFDLRARKDGFDPAGAAGAAAPSSDAFGPPVGARPGPPAAPGPAAPVEPGGWAPPVAPRPDRPPRADG
jgi:hypothetical protein